MRQIGLGIFTLALLGAFCAGVYVIVDSQAFKSSVASTHAMIVSELPSLEAEPGFDQSQDWDQNSSVANRPDHPRVRRMGSSGNGSGRKVIKIPAE